MIDEHRSAPSNDPAGPLGDVRVLDISAFLPGPFASQMLADLGAAVISVEPPLGEPGRLVPGGLHAVSHRNKSSIVLDLKAPDDVRRCLELAARADVMVEGFRPGVADRLGIGYDAVSAMNPGLVYCSLTGYGQDGPRRSTPGHDVNYLLASGFLAFPGAWHDRQGRRPGVPVADLSASGFAAVAILAALHERARTGRGTRLDVALTDAATTLAAVRSGPQLRPTAEHRDHLNPTNDLFASADGVIGIAAVEEQFWTRLRDALAPYDARLGEARFDSARERWTHGDDLTEILGALFARFPSEHWSGVLTAADVPFSTLRTVSEAVEDPQLAIRGIVQELDGERHVTFPVVRDGAPMGRLRRTAGEIGADTARVVAALAAHGDPWELMAEPAR